MDQRQRGLGPKRHGPGLHGTDLQPWGFDSCGPRVEVLIPATIGLVLSLYGLLGFCAVQS